MAKKPTKNEAPATTEAPKTDPKARGPKGVAESAPITLLVGSNPKREGSKAYGRFAFYVNGMSVAEALAAGVTTPDLVYDAQHGFISIEGYTVPGGVIVPKEPKVKVPKEAKAKKVKVEKTDEQKALEAQADTEAQAETIE